jgi:tetratricopeptide (TPR) repeat protein
VEDDDGMAEELALETLGASGAAATEFLKARTRVLDAEYERLHLGHFREWMYTALEVIIGLILALIFAAIASAVYEASRADGLVIEAFSAPPDLAAKGLGGEVLASKLLDRLNAMQNATSSSRAPSSFSHDWNNDIKVAIPDTGISLGEAIRYLHNWLGREMHLTGDLYETAQGIALTVRLDNEPGETFSGPAADLDAIVQRAAEAVFRRAQTYRYAVYLEDHGRRGEAEHVLRQLSLSGSPAERAWAGNGLALSWGLKGREDDALRAGLRAHAQAPDLPNPIAGLAWLEGMRGHDEMALDYARQHLVALDHEGARAMSPELVTYERVSYRATVAELEGDYRAAISGLDAYDAASGTALTDNVIEAAQDTALAHDPSGARERLDALDPEQLKREKPDGVIAADALVARAQAAMAEQDWRAASRLFEQALGLTHARAAASHGFYNDIYYRRIVAGPWLAYADAMQGETAKADAFLKGLPADCYICTRMRGRVAAQEGRADAASWWFARGADQAPSLPFAAADWGRTLLAKGDADGAIAKFEAAHSHAPHFADPLEGLGEALIAKNRSDLALEKFKKAAEFAPNWGRLHLKWGEALFYSGDRSGAEKQFAIARTLALAPSEKSELASVSHG